jgi:hypothetical protein
MNDHQEWISASRHDDMLNKGNPEDYDYECDCGSTYNPTLNIGMTRAGKDDTKWHVIIFVDEDDGNHVYIANNVSEEEGNALCEQLAELNDYLPVRGEYTWIVDNR